MILHVKHLSKSKMHPYKLVCFDLDGTLVTENFELPPAHIAMVQELREAGLMVSIATGRSYQNAKIFLEPLDLVEPLIFCNGAVYDNAETQEREVLHSVPLETALIVLMMESGANLSLKLFMADGTVYKSKDVRWPHEGSNFEEGEVNTNLAAQLDEDPIKIVLHGEPKEMDGFGERLTQILGPKSSVRMFRSHALYLEITHRETSKADALHRVAVQLGVEPHEVITLGDHENDFEMLRDFGLGIQVGDHCKKLEEVADLQIPSPEKGGVANLIPFLQERNILA